MKNTKTIICPICKKEFEKLCNDIKPHHKTNCCSISCKIIASRKRIETFCHTCNKVTIITAKEFKKSKSGFSFCSKSCAAKYNNTLRRKTKRSKIEEKLYNLLIQEFPNLQIIPNDKTMLEGLEVDIAVPTLKLAIEWNGIVHFKPIYGQNKLNKIQSIDQKKLLIAQQKDINLIVIPDLVSNQKILNTAFIQISEIIKELKDQ